MHSISLRAARRLALARAGLLPRRWSGLPERAGWRGLLARKACRAVIRRFGYLQLDTVSVAGARSHALVLLSRLDNLDPELPERLLRPGAPFFEYWGHEASWLPMELYPAFEWRRREYRVHPWWGDLLGEHRQMADSILERIEREGPLRTADLEGASSQGWWNLKLSKKVATALWSAGDLAIRERSGFQRSYDLIERVIPAAVRDAPLPREEGVKALLERALAGHGWATRGTLAATWRLRNMRDEIDRALAELAEEGRVVECALAVDERPGRRPIPDGPTPGGAAPGGSTKAGGRRIAGWVRPADLEAAGELLTARPRRDRGVLLSPFDPLLWDRRRVELLFGFEQLLEIFKPADQRVYGYYCLPVLAGEELVARVDLKAERAAARLHVLSRCYESTGGASPGDPTEEQAVDSALARYADALELALGDR